MAPELQRAMRSRRYDDALAYLALLKRSVSTAYALHSDGDPVRDRFRRLADEAQRRPTPGADASGRSRRIQRKAAKFGVLTPAEEAEREAMEVEDLAQQLTSWSREERGLRYEADERDDLAERLTPRSSTWPAGASTRTRSSTPSSGPSARSARASPTPTS